MYVKLLTDYLFDDDVPTSTVAFESYGSGDALKRSLVKRTYEQALPNLVPSVVGRWKKHKRKVFDCFETL